MVDIYRKSFRYYWSVLPVLIGMMALLETLLWYFEPKQSSALTLVPILIIINQFHRHFLFGETLAFGKLPEGAPPQKFGWFILISLGLLFIPIGLAGIFTFSIAPSGAPKATLYGLMLLAVAPLYLVSLSLFGTALPASVARRGNFRMLAGMRASLGTMWRLLLGPFVVQAVLFGLILGVEYLLKNNPAYQSTVGQLLAGTIASTLGFLPSLMAVAVLCHMYEKVMAGLATHNENAANHS